MPLTTAAHYFVFCKLVGEKNDVEEYQVFICLLLPFRETYLFPFLRQTIVIRKLVDAFLHRKQIRDYNMQNIALILQSRRYSTFLYKARSNTYIVPTKDRVLE